MTKEVKVILLKHDKGWGLTSVSAGCIQVEAYLRIAGVSFAEEILSTTGTSPTGTLPAVDGTAGVGGYTATKPASDLDAAAASIAFLQEKFTDLDKLLGARERAACAAFACLVETKLNAAVLYATWCEQSSGRHLRDTYGDTLPWPLNHIIPMSQAWAIKSTFKNTTADEVYEGGCAAIRAVADCVSSSEGSYILGDKPCSLDAKLYGLLVFITASPVVAPVLKEQVQEHPALLRYVEHISQKHFAMPAPSTLDADVLAAWSAAGKGTPKASQYETAEEKTQKRRSWYWLGGAALLMVGYVALGGQYFDIGITEGDDDDDDD